MKCSGYERNKVTMRNNVPSWKTKQNGYNLVQKKKRKQKEKPICVVNLNTNKTVFGNFNTKSSKYIERSKIRCGGILFTKDFKAIVIVQNKYMLNEENKVLWGLPKGHIKENESFAQCASREIYEETGLVLDVQDTSPKIRINKTYYFPILLNYTLEQLLQKLRVIDVIEIADVCVLHIDKPEIARTNFNYELKLLLGHYLPRAKKIVDVLESKQKKMISK